MNATAIEALGDPRWWRSRCDDAFQEAVDMDELEHAGLRAIGFAAAAGDIDLAADLELQANGLIDVFGLISEQLDSFVTMRMTDAAVALRNLLDRIEAAAVVLAVAGEDRALRSIWWFEALRERGLGRHANPKRFIVEDDGDDLDGCAGIVAIEDEHGRVLDVREFVA
jgi:hypothetical protein